ncbi:prepilin peptidase [Streptomyces sp. CAI-121]|uniref:prepilin peptidase n=1 Tax=unclassified Streptomyces TaxID=2593676 RepID=UPI0015871146|nr:MULTISPECIES: A24 family peptidase [unclassified Streptomyces]NUV66481.1 prepilin peptidase [Streptomyces sp. CAI-121]NUW11837.1 prepilin peptidase [Streptomyces sp. CAI-68]
MDAVLLALAAVWGAATGLLIPRAAYRFAVEPEEPWRTACPAGHPLTGPARGWLGPARCAPCAAHADPATQAAPAAQVTQATPVPETPAPEPQAAPAPEAPAPEAPAPEAPAPEAPAPEPEAPAAKPQASPAPPPPVTTAPPAYAPGTLAPLVTVLVCVALAAATGARPELVGWLVLAPVAVLLAVVDRRVHRLPDVLTLPLAAAAVLLLGGAALLPGHAGSWTSGLLGGLALGGFYLLLFLINPNGMGFGDVKLALALGVALGWYGWTVLFLGGFAGFLFGAAYGLALVLLRRAGRRTGIPFGPFMAAGALTGVLLGALAG